MSGSAGLMKVIKEMVGEWMSTGESRLHRLVELSKRTQRAGEIDEAKKTNLYGLGSRDLMKVGRKVGENGGTAEWQTA